MLLNFLEFFDYTEYFASQVALARPKSEKTKNCNLYITGLPPIADNAYIEQLFAPYGSVINVKVLINQATRKSHFVMVASFFTALIVVVV